jgi:hypothetical protein
VFTVRRRLCCCNVICLLPQDDSDEEGDGDEEEGGEDGSSDDAEVRIGGLSFSLSHKHACTDAVSLCSRHKPRWMCVWSLRAMQPHVSLLHKHARCARNQRHRALAMLRRAVSCCVRRMVVLVTPMR